MIPWTPANLTAGRLELWFDANNRASLSIAGSNVNSWTDLANSVAVTPPGTAPTYTASLLNGLPGIDVSSGGFTNTSTTKAPFTGDMSAFIVLNLTTNTYTSAFGAHITVTQGDPNFGFDNASPAKIGLSRAGLGGTSSTQTLARNTAALAEWITPGVSGGSWGPATPYINGNVGAAISALTGFSFTQNGIEVGQDGVSAGGGEFTGTLHELVILNLQASSTDRQLIEGYLCWKWGLQGSLPGGHPYASVAPTSPSFVENPYHLMPDRLW